MTAVLTTAVGERALVIIPTFNEAESIAEGVRRTLDACGDRADILVIDDGSSDGTAHIVRALAEDSNIDLLERPGKMGLGSAYLTGFRWALERGYGAVVEMDADLSHDPRDIPRLLDGLEGADLVIGSRYVRGGDIRNWGRGRTLLSKAGNVYARALIGFSIRDSTSGFRSYRASIIEEIDLDAVRSEGYAFQIEMTRRVLRAGGVVTEIPITFTERAHGRSKMSRAIVLEALWRVAGWGIGDRFRRSR